MSATRTILLGALLGVTMVLPSTALARVTIMPPRPFPPIYDPPIQPEPPVGYYYRWAPPVYRTVYDRVWVEERTERVMQWVEVAPGRWQECWTVRTIPAHWETTTRQVLVSAGYWELVRIEPPRPIPMPHPVVITPGPVGVDGYSQHGGEDLSKFSPLSEWPDKK